MRLLLAAFALLCLVSCKQRYYYLENGKKETAFEAYSDSAAYIEAFNKFEIAKQAHKNVTKTLGYNTLEEPSYFDLLNSKHEIITGKIVLYNRDSVESSISSKIRSMPNTLDSITKEIREEKNGKGAQYDTGGLYLAPVKVISAKFVEKDYSSYKDVSLKYKNVTNKQIEAIRFKWYGENAFKEPADMGSLSDGWGGGFVDDGLAPNETGYGTWNVLSKDGKKLLIAYPYEVVFKDGSKWVLNN